MLGSSGEGQLPAVFGICGLGNQMIRQGFARMRAHGALADGAGHWLAIASPSLAAIAVHLQLHVLAYNLRIFLWTLAIPKMAELRE